MTERTKEICETAKKIQSSITELNEAERFLTNAANYNLTVEVVVTALHTIIEDPERYKENPLLALEEACRDWDV